MRTESLEFLKQLITTPSPSGYESAAQRIWCGYVRPLADQVRTDAYGNAIAVLNPDGDPKIVLDGHMDEIGLMIKHICDKGFLYFQGIGGVDPALVRGKRVNIHAKRGIVRGVVGATAIHLRDRDKKPEAPKMHKLFIDIGAADGKAARRRVAVGDPITFVDDFEMLDRNIAVGRAFDDRAGCFVVAEVMRMVAAARIKPKCALYVTSSIQEETGCNGAKMHVEAIRPNAAVAVEVTHATDTPGLDVKQHGEVTMSKGPTVTIGREHHPVLVARLRQIADRKKIPLQIEVFSATSGTDAKVMWTANGGVPSAVVGFPNRYMHSTVEMIDLRDVTKTVNLLVAFVLDIKKGERFIVDVQGRAAERARP